MNNTIDTIEKTDKGLKDDVIAELKYEPIVQLGRHQEYSVWTINSLSSGLSFHNNAFN
jgi:hypothetical protein